MTDYVVDELAFAGFIKGERLIVGTNTGIVLQPSIGWLRMMQAMLDAARGGQPSPIPHRLKESSPPDPPQAREFLPNRYTRRPE